MNELHKRLNNAPLPQPSKEQDHLLCEGKNTLSKETLDALEELGDVLRGIHKRMVHEGYEIVDGNIRKVVSQM
jgi:hypothetical protein